ncbi:MAG: hypothetical protein R3A13_10410 [Bdellovibrionota bacterium]
MEFETQKITKLFDAFGCEIGSETSEHAKPCISEELSVEGSFDNPTQTLSGFEDIQRARGSLTLASSIAAKAVYFVHELDDSFSLELNIYRRHCKASVHDTETGEQINPQQIAYRGVKLYTPELVDNVKEIFTEIFNWITRVFSNARTKIKIKTHPIFSEQQLIPIQDKNGSVLTEPILNAAILSPQIVKLDCKPEEIAFLKIVADWLGKRGAATHSKSLFIAAQDIFAKVEKLKDPIKPLESSPVCLGSRQLIILNQAFLHIAKHSKKARERVISQKLINQIRAKVRKVA